MPDRLGYVVTERDVQLALITERGEIRLISEREDAPPPPPDWLREVIRVRRSIGDPVAGDFVYAGELPETAQPNIAFTTGDGAYQFHAAGGWKPYALKFGDSYIRLLAGERGRLKAAIRLIDDLIARIDPGKYLTAGNAGGQSMSFPSLGETLAYYQALRDRLKEEEAEAEGVNSGIMLKSKRRPVGGIIEEF